MGEARRKKQELTVLLLKQMDRWDFPPSDLEATAVTEIGQLPKIWVYRWPNDKLQWMRMKPNECHANARFMQEKDPEGKCKQVSGYLIEHGNYVLHSVVQREKEVFCVTPSILNAPERFRFIPDPEIDWIEEGEFRVAYRKGIKVEPGFRSDPSEHRRISEIVRARLDAGVHPLKAGEPPF